MALRGSNACIQCSTMHAYNAHSTPFCSTTKQLPYSFLILDVPYSSYGPSKLAPQPFRKNIHSPRRKWTIGPEPDLGTLAIVLSNSYYLFWDRTFLTKVMASKNWLQKQAHQHTPTHPHPHTHTHTPWSAEPVAINASISSTTADTFASGQIWAPLLVCHHKRAGDRGKPHRIHDTQTLVGSAQARVTKLPHHHEAIHITRSHPYSQSDLSSWVIIILLRLILKVIRR